MFTTKLAVGLVAAACAAGLVACGDDDTKDSASTTATAGSGVEVTDAWSRVTAPSQTSGAVYLTITSAEGDTLTKAEVPTSVAKMTQLHESTGSMGSGAMKGMKEVPSIEIPAGQTVTLKPGGYHIMLMELQGPITDGQKIPVTLTFAKAGTVKVDATARTA